MYRAKEFLIHRAREFFIDNLLVRIHLVFEMIWWTGLAPWEVESLFRFEQPAKQEKELARLAQEEGVSESWISTTTHTHTLARARAHTHAHTHTHTHTHTSGDLRVALAHQPLLRLLTTYWSEST